MNNVTLIGRLTRDPEVRYTPDGMAVSRFSIAVDRPTRQGKDHEADFPTIVVFGKQAENCERYLEKGRQIGVEGRLQTGSYTNKDGVKIYTTEVIANRVEFLGGSSQRASASAEERPPFVPATDDPKWEDEGEKKPKADEGEQVNFAAIEDDDDILF